MSDNWKSNPSLKGIDPKKLEFLNYFAEQAKGSNQDGMLPLLLSVTNMAKQKGISFSKQETDLLFQILSTNLTPEQKKQFDNMRNMAAMMQNKK